jgi:hypothetical protein
MEPKMSAMSMAALSGLGAAHGLRQVMRGKAALPGDAGYGSAGRLWNGAVDSHLADQRDWAAFGNGCKTVRLQRARRRFDPDRAFTSATLLP